MSQNQPPSPESKIQSPELRRLAEEHSTEVASVIIELELPARKVEVERVLRRGVEMALPRRVTSPTAAEGGEAEKREAEAKSFLRQVLGVSPRWLGAARSFVADVTGPPPEPLPAIALAALTHRYPTACSSNSSA
jgi:hypothetical protein